MKRAIHALIAASIAACVFDAASSLDSERDDYVSIVITDDHNDAILDSVSIHLEDSRVARTIFSLNTHDANYDNVRVREMNALTRVISESDLAYVCRAMRATDTECFS